MVQLNFDANNPISDFIGIKRLILTQFRNHARLEINPNSKAIALVGPNGTGKTNILEAISILGQGRGLRSADLADMSRHGDNGGSFAVSSLIGNSPDEHRLGVGHDTVANRKITRLDGREITAKQTLDVMRLIWLTPQMDRLFAATQSEKRKFLDRLVVSFMPQIAAQNSAYEKLLRERQKLLEEDRRDNIWLSTIEEQAAAAAIAIASARIETLSALQSEILGRPDGEFPKSQLVLNGEIEQKLIEGENQTAIEGAIAEKFATNRNLDKAAKRATFGVHKSEFGAIHIPTQMEAQNCSTGEQKALIIGLILAQARLVSGGVNISENACFNAPNVILLLDEAQAHFDSKRREALARETMALKGQIWLTGTDQYLFDAFGNNGECYNISPSSAVKINI